MPEPKEGTLFKAEYEREMEAWLRRRFGWMLGATIVYEVIALLGAIGGLLFFRMTQGADPGAAIDPQDTDALEALRENAPEFLTFTILATILVLAVAARAFIAVRPKLESREQTLRATNWFILEIGAITFGADLAMHLLFPAQMGPRGASGLSTIFVLHILPSIFLPWSPRESLRPMYPLASMFILELITLKIAGQANTAAVVGMLALAPLILAPGLIINWWRLRTHRRRFDRRMVTKGFFSMRRELSQARAVQMALFPKLVRWPHLEFDYAYQPANEVGGDFIHASVDEKGRLDVIVLDVTGHGLASALTVARLSGEIERLLAEDPDISPGAVLRALNRYVTLTLAKHSVYLTAVAVQVDPGHGTVRYVNAGHPPAWVRRADGRVERFDSTTFLLGAVADADFDADETTIVLGPLDTMVLVTDGVHEASDRAGRQFGLERIQEMLSRNPVPDRWCGHLAQIVEQWRGRIGDDDLLVATIRVPSATPPLPPTRSLAEDIEQETTYAPQVPAGGDAAYGVDTAAKAGARA
jgi:hypothetical protein